MSGNWWRRVSWAAAAAIVLAGLVVAARTSGRAQDRTVNSAGTVWLASFAQGRLVQVSGSTGDVMGSVRLEGLPQGEPFETVQLGPNALAVRKDLGKIVRVSASTLQASAATQLSSGAFDRIVTDGKDRAFVAAGRSLTIIDVSSNTLARSDPFDLGAPVDDMAVDRDGVLWTLDASAAQVTSFANGKVVSSRLLERAGVGSQLASAGGRVAVVSMSPPGISPVERNSWSCATELGSATSIVVGANDPVSTAVTVLSTEPTTLVRADLASGRCRVAPITGTNLGPPVSVGDVTAVPDYGSGAVLRVDWQPPTPTVETLKLDGIEVGDRFELFAKAPYVLYNDPATDNAGVIVPQRRLVAKADVQTSGSIGALGKDPSTTEGKTLQVDPKITVPTASTSTLPPTTTTTGPTTTVAPSTTSSTAPTTTQTTAPTTTTTSPTSTTPTSPTSTTPTSALDKRVPGSICGSGFALAKATLEGLGFKVNAAPVKETSDRPVDTVIRVNPVNCDSVVPASQLGAAFDLVVSVGQICVDGSSPADAKSTIERAGYVVGEEIGEVSTAVKIGLVTRTEPACRVSSPAGTLYRLFVSKGTTMPSFLGLTQKEAESAATTNNVRPEYLLEKPQPPFVAAPGTVFSQTVAPNSLVDPGSGVTLRISPKATSLLVCSQDSVNKTAGNCNFDVGQVKATSAVWTATGPGTITLGPLEKLAAVRVQAGSGAAGTYSVTVDLTFENGETAKHTQDVVLQAPC